jgi:hypothetical protein
LAVKTGDLTKIRGVDAIVNETIDHGRGCHVVRTGHKNGAKANVVNEFGVEIEN